MSYLDTCTLDDELDELESRASCDECGGNGGSAEFEEGCQHTFADPLTDEEEERYSALVELRDEFDARDWRSGVQLIPEFEFEDYARDLAEELFLTGGADNPLLDYVDWSRWADAVQMDYTSVEFDGDTYYYRS